MSIRNETSYPIDIAAVLAQGPDVRLSADEPQILIIHTHSSEAYTPAGLDRYEASDTCRTEDTEYNIVRIGDELTALLTEAGLNVIHDRGIYDYPSYAGRDTALRGRRCPSFVGAGGIGVRCRIFATPTWCP